MTKGKGRTKASRRWQDKGHAQATYQDDTLGNGQHGQSKGLKG